MGQQVYEEHIVRAIAAVSQSTWDVKVRTVCSLRSSDPADVRLPLRLSSSLPLGLQKMVGRAVYGSSDLVHRTDLRIPSGPDPEVLTIHDLAALRYPDEGTLSERMARSARQAAVVVTVSEFSAAEIEATLGISRPVVIPNGFDPDLLEATPLNPRQLEALGIGPRFVLNVGGATIRKNLDGLAGAWRNLATAEPDLHLVLCGPPHPRRTELFAELPRCHLLGWVERKTVIGLLRAASAVVTPSVYEGFGLPVLEAMAVGTPVVAARRASLPEVCGDDAVLVEPDGEALAAGITTVLHDPCIPSMVERARRRALTFTWERAGLRYVELYERTLAS